MYPFDAELNAARCVEVPRNTDFSLNMDGIKKAVDEYKPKLLFTASPNNPDGSLIPSDVMDELLVLPLLVVLDEAYIEFAGENLGASLSRIREVPQRENLVVLRTFSKWAGNANNNNVSFISVRNNTTPRITAWTICELMSVTMTMS